MQLSERRRCVTRLRYDAQLTAVTIRRTVRTPLVRPLHSLWGTTHTKDGPMQHALTRKEFLRWSLALATVVACSDSAKTDANESKDSGTPPDESSGDAAIESAQTDGGGPQDALGPLADANSDAALKAGEGPAGVCKTDIVLGDAQIDGNHGHGLLIAAVDLASTSDKTYPSIGGDHVHTLTINAASFAALRAGFPVMLQSGSESGHSHACWLRCLT